MTDDRKFKKRRRRCYEQRWLKNELVFYLRISLSKYLETEYGTQFQIRNGSLKKKLSPFTLSRQRKGGSFHVVVLQIYAKKFTKIFYPRTQPLFYSLNVLFRVVPVTVVTFLNCLASRCSQDGSWNNKSIF